MWYDTDRNHIPEVLLMKQIPKFPLIMTIAAFVCFLLAYGFLIICTILPPHRGTMALLVPTAVLGLITLLGYHRILTEGAADVLTSILSILFILAAIPYTLTIGVLADLEGTKDIRYYERLYDRLEDRPGVGNFPEEVPDSVGEILFHWNPQVLQGSERFKITFTPDAQTYEQYRDARPEKSVWYGPWKEWCGYGRRDAEGTVYVFFWDEEYNHPEISYAVLHPDGSVTFSYTRG